MREFGPRPDRTAEWRRHGRIRGQGLGKHSHWSRSMVTAQKALATLHQLLHQPAQVRVSNVE